MARLEFETTGDWNIQGSSQKDFYISFVARVDDWKRNIIFYREEIGDKAFNFLLNQALEKRIEKGWKFSVITRGKFMNSTFVFTSPLNRKRMRKQNFWRK